MQGPSAGCFGGIIVGCPSYSPLSSFGFEPWVDSFNVESSVGPFAAKSWVGSNDVEFWVDFLDATCEPERVGVGIGLSTVSGGVEDSSSGVVGGGSSWGVLTGSGFFVTLGSSGGGVKGLGSDTLSVLGLGFAFVSQGWGVFSCGFLDRSC